MKATEAAQADLPAAMDLFDTLMAHRDHCIGMAANMIGKNKRIIAVMNGEEVLIMLNPRILEKKEPWETEEGCLSLSGVRKTTRWREIRVAWQDIHFRPKEGVFRGLTAQAIQHEADHLEGILI
ncbi:MAG: peptide deformylase [Bacteroidales bacterium]|nr:peptide deformylase [Bacteroidales bacterium]